MKIKHVWILLGLLMSFLLISCEDEGVSDEFTHKYEQTQCSDPWGDERESNAFSRAVIDYLEDKLINVQDSKVETVSGNFCAACNCPTGSTIQIKLSEGDGQKLMDLNEGWEAL